MVENRPQHLRTLLTAAVAAFALAANALTLSNRYRSPRNPERPIRKSTRLVVLHTTEAHARSSLNKLCERGEAHYCVVENGTVYRIVDREREAFHAGRSVWNAKEDCDAYSVGIEVVGYHDKPITLQQIDALRELIDNLKKIYNLSDSQVVCHSHVAYGAPNKWQRRNHRGRKRCGMLFAMPSVRSRLNLKAKPAFDPDVKSGRLVQADGYLAQVLYGSVDTMAAHYKRSAAPAATAPKAASDGGIFAGIKKLFTRGELKNPKPSNFPTFQPSNSPTSQPSNTPTSKPSNFPTFQPSNSPKGDPVRDLAMLKSLPGYIQGGPTTAELTPYKIAGKKWKSSDTYYYINGKIIRGDRIDEKRIVKGTLIFYKKP